MARVKGAMMTRKRRKKTLKLAKGYWGAKSRHFKMAKQAVMKSGNYAYIGRLRTLNLTYFVIAFGLSQTQLFFTENWMVL